MSVCVTTVTVFFCDFVMLSYTLKKCSQLWRDSISKCGLLFHNLTVFFARSFSFCLSVFLLVFGVSLFDCQGPRLHTRERRRRLKRDFLRLLFSVVVSLWLLLLLFVECVVVVVYKTFCLADFSL